MDLRRIEVFAQCVESERSDTSESPDVAPLTVEVGTRSGPQLGVLGWNVRAHIFGVRA